MLSIGVNKEISLTRGDSANFQVSITDVVSKETYEMQENDTLRFTVKKSTSSSERIIQKEIQGATSFALVPSDTSGLEFGKYVYDVELTTASGDVYTVIPPSRFVLTEEVTW